MDSEKEPISDEVNEKPEFEIDESQIRTGQPTEEMEVSTDGGESRSELNWWATYDGSIEGYRNVSGYGDSEEEAKQDLRNKIEDYVKNKGK